MHAEIRQYFSSQLPAMLPSGYEAVAVPHGFKSAGWNRDSSRAMAAALAADTTIHLVVAMGPWTVEDLLAAGFERPIIAAYRFDPVSEGLVDSTGRPIADNLTVRVQHRRLEMDLGAIASLVHPKQLGILLFPSGDESGRILAEARKIGERLGFEVVTAEGFDNKKIYAFFNARAALPKTVDALYLGPLWGFNSDKARQFYSTLIRDHVAAYSCEGEYQVVRGALAAGNGEAVEVSAYYEAWKAAQIIQGARPADLPTLLPAQGTIWLNRYVAEALGATVSPDMWLMANVIDAPPADDIERLSLSDAVDRALAQNPDHQSRNDVLEAAASSARVAASAYLPRVQLDASAFRADRNTVHNDDRYDAGRYQAALSIDQPLFSLETIRDIQIARADRGLAQRDFEQATLDLELAVTVAYLDVQRLRQAEVLASYYRMAVSKALQAAQARSVLREDRPSDVLRLDSESRRALRTQVDARCNAQVAGVVLNTLLGRPGDTRFVATTEPLSANLVMACEEHLQRLLGVPEGPATVTDYLMTQALASSPALEKTRLSLARQQLVLGRNTARFLPEVQLHGRLGLVDERHETATFEEEHSTWSIGASLSLPLYLGGGRSVERQLSRWEFQSLEYLRDDAYLRAHGAVQTYLLQMQAFATDYALSVRALEESTEYVRSIIPDYASGARSVAEVVDAARDEYQTALEALAARTGCSIAAARIMHQVGWNPGERGAVPENSLLTRLQAMGTPTGTR
jgi:outer membrane protein TolC